MIVIKEEDFQKRFEKTEEYMELYEKYAQPIVVEVLETLDETVDKINDYLNKIKNGIREYDIVTLQNISLDLAAVLYYVAARHEQINVQAEISKLLYKDRYATEYLEKQGNYDAGTKFSTEQLRNHAEIEAVEENLISILYSAASRVIKTKIDAGNELLKIVSKALSAEMEKMRNFRG